MTIDTVFLYFYNSNRWAMYQLCYSVILHYGQAIIKKCLKIKKPSDLSSNIDHQEIQAEFKLLSSSSNTFEIPQEEII